MFDVEELLSKRNQRNALEHLLSKKDGCGIDGIRISEFKEYWEVNHLNIEKEIREGTYTPGVVKTYEIVNNRGKQRIVSSLNVTDRMISRMLAQKLKRYIEPDFMPESFAYQDNKGILAAVIKAKEYVEKGNEIVVEIDFKNYFDCIQLDKLYSLVTNYIKDCKVCSLIKSYLYCKIEFEGRIKNKEVGLVQGNSISPILSNLYLHSLDKYMSDTKWNWIRFADNIYLFTSTNDNAIEIYNHLCEKIKNEYQLDINMKKSGIYNVFNISMLGYEFYKSKNRIEVKKKQYEKRTMYQKWNQSVISKVNREFHIVQDGILNKKDYALLFENEEEKHHIPVEITNSINMYGNITVASNVLDTLRKKGIAINFFDKYGNIMGYFVPENYGYYSAALLKQCEVYINSDIRLNMAKKMEIAGIHNMKANLKYYNKKGYGLKKQIEELSLENIAINESKSIDEMMLIEARARQIYYMAFNEILKNNMEFRFIKRTKRPPLDEINAMISFGNTLLYNQFLQIIAKTSLDPRIGVVHATNRRNYSLNLDFADIFKPIISDRVIFSLINYKQIKADKHFHKNEDGSVFMNKQGKRIFLEKFEEKLNTKLVLKGKSYTYKQLMVEEVRNFQKYILNQEKYSPYKYY